MISSYYDDQCEFSRDKYVRVNRLKNSLSAFASLTIGHLIGKGAFGFVYQGLAEGINPKEKITTVAVKTIRGETIERIEQSVTLLSIVF